jgi:SAM-dependent methyltransferase
MPSADEQREVFAYSAYHAIHYAGDNSEEHQRSLSAIAHHAPHARSLLDFGCGSGTFLRAARAAGYTCAGVEYEADAIARAAELSGARVTTLEDALQAGDRFDVVRLGDVMVAMRAPREVLRSLEGLMARGARLVIETSLDNNPSIAYWSTASVKWIARRLGRDSVAQRAPTLVWRTDGRTMTAFFEQELGYRLVSYELRDDGWPLWTPGQAPTGLRGHVKSALGRLAVGLSRHGGPLKERLGNHGTIVLVPPGRQM